MASGYWWPSYLSKVACNQTLKSYPRCCLWQVAVHGQNYVGDAEGACRYYGGAGAPLPPALAVGAGRSETSCAILCLRQA